MESKEIQATGVLHAEYIEAALDGKIIQYKDVHNRWVNLVNRDSTIRFILREPTRTFRVKPTPYLRRQIVVKNSNGDIYVENWGGTDEGAKEYAKRIGAKVLYLEFDPETLEVMSHRTENP